MPTVDCNGYNAVKKDNPDDLLRFGPTVIVRVGIGSQNEQEVRALIDTGAEHDGIDADFAKEFGFPARDQISGTHTFHGIKNEAVDVFAVQIQIPHFGGMYASKFVGGTLSNTDYPYKILLGRTFLKQHQLQYDGVTGIVQLSKINA